jgi:hypothetical protein
VSASAHLVQPVSPEFKGQARSWLSKLDADNASFDSLADALARTVREPIKRGKIATPEMLQELARRWRDELPTEGRLQLEIDISQRCLAIRDLRIARSEQFLGHWTHGEDALVIFIACVTAKRRSYFTFQRHLCATVGLHALSRRFQRAFDCSDEAIRADLIALAGATEENYHPDGRFHVRVPDGVWAGKLQIFDHDDTYAWCARTFLSAAEVEAA